MTRRKKLKPAPDFEVTSGYGERVCMRCGHTMVYLMGHTPRICALCGKPVHTLDDFHLGPAAAGGDMWEATG